jgi:hypothetical protein
MATNIDKYKNDLEKLIKLGEDLFNAMQFEVYPEEFKKQVKSAFKTEKEIKDFYKKLPSFKQSYQKWYSECFVLIKQLMPDRLNDFVRYYEKAKTRKVVEWGNYVIEDYLQGMTVTKGWDKIKVVGTDAAIPQFLQQLNILKSLSTRFESTLFDLKQLVQADLFDSELLSAKELLKHKFARAAGALAGVVLEKHLAQVAIAHNLILKKNPAINDLNEILKNNNVIDTAQWRFIQHLGDIRNLCSHNKDKEPSQQDGEDLISGVDKIIKTVF